MPVKPGPPPPIPPLRAPETVHIPSANKTLTFTQYTDEDKQLPEISTLIKQQLSEPYSIFTYRYFLNQWPQLTFLVYEGSKCVGTVVCKLDDHRGSFRGYVAMLVVAPEARKLGLGSMLVERALEVMHEMGADECVLEAESTNKGALRLYENLGFIRDKRLHRYYLSGTDAFRLKLCFPLPPEGSVALMREDDEYL
jgi:peptide alpha-N-acetyltransferase